MRSLFPVTRFIGLLQVHTDTYAKETNLRTQTCPDCKSKMEEGFIPDFGNPIVQMMWQSGTAERRTVLGMEHGIKFDRSEVLKISVYRCVECGLLRSYAEEKAF
jgi:DNA-directed RNA polymerase subunit RPC12/RpoP